MLGSYAGKETYYVLSKDTILLKDGKYTFISDLLKEASNDSVFFKELKLEGNYADDKKQGSWKYKLYEYLLHDVTIHRSWNASLKHNLSGIEDVVSIDYNDEHFEGNTYWDRKSVKNGRYGKTNRVAAFSYNKDTLIGDFFFRNAGVEITGQLDSTGFLDGQLQLKYDDSGSQIQETRTYDRGFLIKIEKFDVTENEELLIIRFDDVIEQLQLISDESVNSQLEVSDRYFGPKFNFGYQQDDLRITAQSRGNQILEKHLLSFDSVHNIHSGVSSRKTVLKLTRRFQFIYDDKDDSLSTSLLVDVRSLKQHVSAFLNKPNVLLRKDNSDNIYQQYEVLSLILLKLDILDHTLEKITSGYFDFRFRDSYYENGVPGLNKNDTVFFELKNTVFKTPFLVRNKVDRPESLIADMFGYHEGLKELSGNLISSIMESLTLYDNQEKIDSLDRVISGNDVRISELYAEKSRFENEAFAEIPYSYKALLSLKERMLDKQYHMYLHNSLSQDELISLGANVICIQAFLIENHLLLDEIGRIKENWNDSLFTAYRDNPFDYRELETKFLEGVQNSVNILLTEYANQLLNAKNCQQLNEEIQKIRRLNERVRYLVENQDMEKVQQLNKAMRRERVPQRIERFLEL